MDKAPAPQKVVVYTNQDGDIVPYATAYTAEQMQYYTERCLAEHGVKSRPRTRHA